jgi:hypothetical protein
VRITVGGVLIIAAIGAGSYFVFQNLTSEDQLEGDWARKKASGVVKDFKSTVSLFMPGDGNKETTKPVLPTYEPPLSSQPLADNTTAQISTEDSFVKGTTTSVVAPIAAVSSAPAVSAPAPVVIAPAASKTPRKKKGSMSIVLHRRKTMNKQRFDPNAATAKPVKKTSLVGKNVVLELKTGQKIQGLLQAKTANQYKLELPGMGSLDYPISEVRSIQLAQ